MRGVLGCHGFGGWRFLITADLQCAFALHASDGSGGGKDGPIGRLYEQI